MGVGDLSYVPPRRGNRLRHQSDRRYGGSDGMDGWLRHRELSFFSFSLSTLCREVLLEVTPKHLGTSVPALPYSALLE
jgi:hypothetical protein